MLSIEDLSYMIEIGREAMEDVRGGRINLHKLGPTPKHTAADGLGAGYFLPEMEMDTIPSGTVLVCALCPFMRHSCRLLFIRE